MRSRFRAHAALLLVVLGAFGGASAGCDACGDRGEAARDGHVSVWSGDGPPSAPGVGGEPEAPRRGGSSNLAEGGVSSERLVGRGAVEPCSGTDVDILAVLGDARCATTAMEARRLRAVAEGAGAQTALRQEALRAADGTVTVRLVNEGPRSVVVPLLHHPSLPAFTALADDGHGAVLELAPPTFAAGDEPDRGFADGGEGQARFARIVLPPGGVAFARVSVSPAVVRRIDKSCPDGGRCAVDRLAPGTYVVHIGQLVADLDAGPPARVALDLR